MKYSGEKREINYRPAFWDFQESRRWHLVRSTGKWNYVLFHGIFSIGIPLALISIFLSIMVEAIFDWNMMAATLANSKFIFSIIGRIILLPVAATLYFLYKWNYMEKNYKKNLTTKYFIHLN
jgi:hypothetical protein